MIELTRHGRAWAHARRDLNLMAEVVLAPERWPAGFVRLARRYANDAGAEHEAKLLFKDVLEIVGPEATVQILRRALA